MASKAVEKLAEQAHKDMTDHEIAVYETRIGNMQTITEEVGYFGLLGIVRDAMRRVLVDDGQSIEYADSMLVSTAKEVTTP